MLDLRCPQKKAAGIVSPWQGERCPLLPLTGSQSRFEASERSLCLRVSATSARAAGFGAIISYGVATFISLVISVVSVL